MQKARHGYKLVKSLFGKYEEIPEEWNLAKLGNHSTLFVPMRDKPKKFGGEVDWLRIEDFDGKYVSHSKSNQKVSLETIKEMKLRVYPVGTVLCSCSATIGAYAITARELITNQTFIGIYPNDDLDKEFLYYYLNTQTNNLIKIGSGTTILYISREKFEEFPIVLPPLNEQQKIASILSNVDSLIDQTRKIIEQTQKLKKGLMQKLLTRGIGHTKFKRVKLSSGIYDEIPEKWDYSKIKNVCNKISVGIATSTTKYFVDKGVPLLRNQNIKEGYVETNDLLYITEQFAKINESKKLREGDVVCMRTGYPGQSAVVTSEMRGWQTFTTLIVRPDHEILTPHYFSMFMNSIGRKQIISIQAGAAQQNLNAGWLSNMLILLPPLQEQQKIVIILSNIISQIQKQQEYKSKLESLKKGLMQKLLTGQMRVKV